MSCDSEDSSTDPGPSTLTGICRIAHSLLGDRFMHTGRRWLKYDGTKWLPGYTAELREALSTDVWQHLESMRQEHGDRVVSSAQRKLKNAVLKSRILGRCKRLFLRQPTDLYKGRLICFRNGVLDTLTFEFHRKVPPAYLITVWFDTDYDPDGFSLPELLALLSHQNA